MSLLLIWYWINSNRESRPPLSCPLSPRAALTNTHTHSSSAGHVACLTFHSFSPSFLLLLSHPCIKSTWRIFVQRLSTVRFDDCVSFLRDKAPSTLSHNVSLSLAKQSVVQPCRLVWAHAVHRSSPLSFSRGWKVAVKWQLLYSQLGRKQHCCFSTAGPRQVTSTWTRPGKLH